MSSFQLPKGEDVYSKLGNVVVFNQLAVKIEMDEVSNEEYFTWLDRMRTSIGDLVPGAQIAEKDNARVSPPLNTAVYYDTPAREILQTGALLRTSCNKITHAFCAFKAAEDEHSVRRDHRHVFDGEEKRTIQKDPLSKESVAIVRQLLSRKDIEHPGTFLERTYEIKAEDLAPSLALDDLRFTFFVWLDDQDALRCSVDRFEVWDVRLPSEDQTRKPVGEVELAIYPRVSPHVAQDPRVPELIRVLSTALCDEFDVRITKKIKYQRAGKVLGIYDD